MTTRTLYEKALAVVAHVGPSPGRGPLFDKLLLDLADAVEDARIKVPKAESPYSPYLDLMRERPSPHAPHKESDR